MKIYASEKIRNAVLLGHAGSGKTTLSETMLYESKTIPRRGTVEDHNTVSDYHEIEHEKEKSVFGSILHLDWRGQKINLFDTPGTSDYIGEVMGPLKVADTAIFVLNAEQGVEVGTELYWRHANTLQKPSLIMVNKLDHAQSDFQQCVDMAKERFGREVCIIQYPYSEGEDFHGIIDVLKMTMYEFPESGGRPDKLPIPDSQRTQAELLHNELVEMVAENDESIMDIYFEKGELDEDQMVDGLHSAMMKRQLFPLFCCSAKKNMGTGRVMGFLGDVAPNPVEAVLHESGEQTDAVSDVIEADPEMFIFHSSTEQHIGDMNYFRMYRGSVEPGMDLENNHNLNIERTSALYIMQGAERVEVNEIRAGDIGAAVKLKESKTNDTLRLKGSQAEISPIEFPETTIRTAIKLKHEGDEDKLGNTLHQIEREDPALQVEHSQELKQIILHGQGEEHLAVIKYELENRFDLDIEFYEPRIPYRETITKSYRAHYKHKKQTGGAGQFAEVYLLIEPYKEGKPPAEDLNVRDEEVYDLPWGGKLVFLNCIVGGVIDNRFMPAILKGIMEKMENGPMTGCRVRDVRISVFDGSMHSVDSNEAAFKTAALMAFRDGFLKCNPQLMEPIYEVEVTVPAENMGDIMSDLGTRRGQIQGMDTDGQLQKVIAHVPLVELSHYSTSLKSMTQGKAVHHRKFLQYAQVPGDVQQNIIKDVAEYEGR